MSFSPQKPNYRSTKNIIIYTRIIKKSETMKRKLRLLLTCIVAILVSQASYAKCLVNVRDSLKLLKKEGRHFQIKTKGYIKKPSYTYSFLNWFGFDNHFQGVKKFNRSTIFVSGGDVHRKKGELFLFNGKNEFVKSFDITKDDLWHVGGLGGVGSVLVAPIEDYRKDVSRIRFYDISTVGTISDIEIDIIRKKKDAGAADLYRRKDRYYELVVFNQSSLDFYTSKTKNITDGFLKNPRTWQVRMLINQNKQKFKAQSLHFLPQCSGELYLLTLANDGIYPPLLNGQDVAVLYRVKNLLKKSKKIFLSEVIRENFICNGKCNFSAAGGVHISPARELTLMSTNYYMMLFESSISMKYFERRKL